MRLSLAKAREPQIESTVYFIFSYQEGRATCELKGTPPSRSG